ncbi:hypothetical protein FM076_27825 [Streptomyces albus subsp. chlorinus]|uniref:hypothetical protein n=1 Tax=Streptomyces albus TaxID=1888 RepID=UPI00156FB3FA|nr:hypothetical protein [Streptomyces albus]NSC24758.1 hypothetical protein [Streptomyces albus subsp. chlorinus]
MPEANSPSSSSPHVSTEDRARADAPATAPGGGASGAHEAPGPDEARQEHGPDEARQERVPHEARQERVPHEAREAHEIREAHELREVHQPPEAHEPYAHGDEEGRPSLTPRQARRVRIVLSAVVMLAVAVALVIRLGSAPSVLTVGFYGVALILSGTAIALSRRGRTRVATAVLALGFVLVVFGEWLLGFSAGP